MSKAAVDPRTGTRKRNRYVLGKRKECRAGKVLCHGDLILSANDEANGVWLVRWFGERRARLNRKAVCKSSKKTPTEEQTNKLRLIGVKSNKILAQGLSAAGK